MKLIREFDDLTWIKDVTENPWLEYDCIIFDIQPDPEVVNQLIELALSSRKVGNDKEWREDIEQDINSIITYQKKEGSSYLRIGNNTNMYYGDDVGRMFDYADVKAAYYSELYKKNINESKDEWDWARDIKPELPFEYVEPNQYYNVTVLDKLVQAMDNCYGESQTHLKYLDATRVKVWEKEYLTYDDLWCSGYEEDDDETLGLEVDFIDADGELMGDFWVSDEMVKLFPLNLNESKDELDWIRDIEPTITDINNPPMVGDVLICLPGFNDTDEDDDGGGGGYVEGRIIVVGSVDVWEFDHPGKQIIVWPDRDMSAEYWNDDTGCFSCGIYGRALTYYKQ